MRFKLVTILIFGLLFSAPVQAQNIDCSADLSQAQTALDQAQAAIDSSDTSTALTFMTEAQNALAYQIASCMNYAPDTAGDTRTNPVPFGQARQVELPDDRKATVQLLSFDPMPSAVDTVGKEADEGMRYILAQYSYYCDASPDKKCSVDSLPFSAVGSANKEYTPRSNNLQSSGGETLYGGGETTRYLVFLVEADETDFVIEFAPSADSAFFATN